MDAQSALYHLIPTNTHTDVSGGFEKILEYLLTYVGELHITREQNHALISYAQGPPFASLAITHRYPTNAAPAAQQLILTCGQLDSSPINLIRQQTNRMGYRIYNLQTQSFLINDPNLLLILPQETDQKIIAILTRYHLTPLFRYNGSLVFFAQDPSGRIHLVNRHLLEYLMNTPQETLFPDEMSCVVAPAIGMFVARADRGIIPVSFHKYRDTKGKIMNFNGLTLEKLYTTVHVSCIYFVYEEITQSFVQTDYTHVPALIPVAKGESLPAAVNKEMKKAHIPAYLCLKIAQDIGYQKQKNTLIPIVSVSVFLNSISHVNW